MNEYTDRDESQIHMFGCTVTELRSFIEAIPTDRPSSRKVYIMGIISDAQHTADADFRDQLLNRAKYYLDNYFQAII